MQRVRRQCGHRDEHKNILRDEEHGEMLRVARSRIHLSQVNLGVKRHNRTDDSTRGALT